MNRRALVRRPSPRLAEGLLTHIERVPVDVDLALQQWDGYVAALHAEGWETVEVPPSPECPDSVFVEDTVVMYADLAVIARPGADERKPETAGTERTLRELGYRIVHIEAPGTLDGGDVLKHDGTVWVGLGGRTNQAGVDQLAAHLGPLGAQVVGVPLTKVLHLKSAVTALPDGTVVGFEELVDDPGVWSRFLAVPEEPGAHVVLLDEDTVLMSTSAPQTQRIYEERGLRVVAVDMTEFEKLEGCVTCLSVRLRADTRRASAERQAVALDDRRGRLHIRLATVGGDERTQVDVVGCRADQLEGLLQAAGRDELQHARGLGGCVPEGVPLAARLEDQVADLGDALLAVGQIPDPALEDQAELVLLGVPVDRCGNRVRREQVLHDRESASPVPGVDEEPVAYAVHGSQDESLSGSQDATSRALGHGETWLGRDAVAIVS